MLENLKSNEILRFFLDCTYKAVPPSKPKFKLLVLSGIDQEEKKTKLCCFILLHKEGEITFDNIFKHLKEKYSFRPYNLMCDFIFNFFTSTSLFQFFHFNFKSTYHFLIIFIMNYYIFFNHLNYINHL